MPKSNVKSETKVKAEPAPVPEANAESASAFEPEAASETDRFGRPSAKQIELVQTSFKKIVPIADAAAEMFYNRLFELDPSVKPLFKGDRRMQGRKLMSMIVTAVSDLNDLDKLIPTVKMLGIRHADYDVINKHYDTVGEALLWTFEQGLGKNFTPDVKDAWGVVYALLADIMKDATKATAAA